MSDHAIHLTPTGPPETILDAEGVEIESSLANALSADQAAQRDAVSAVAARYPQSLFAWAEVGDLARDDVEAYAAYRVGYHRGLDRLRQSGWRGSGYVRWSYPTNRGFLRALDGLRRVAGVIGEGDEEERCALFLRQLDPDWPPAS